MNTKKIITSVSAKGEGIESILASQIDKIGRSIVDDLSYQSSDELPLPKPIIELTTSSLEAYDYYLRGNDKFSTLSWEYAAENYKKAIMIDPNFAMAYNNLAVCYSYLYKFDEMRNAISKALNLSDSVSEKEKLFIEGQYEILITGNYQKAFKIYSNLSNEYPKDKRILMYKVFCANKIYGIKKSIDLYKNILALDKTHGNSLNILGYYYLFDSNLDSAKKYFDLQLEAYPQEANSYDAIGDYNLVVGNIKNSRNYYNNSLVIDPNFGVVKIKYAYSYALEEDFETAKKIILEDINFTSGYAKCIRLNWLAYFEFITRNYNKAFELLGESRENASKYRYSGRLIYNNFLSFWFNLEIGNYEDTKSYLKNYLVLITDSDYRELEKTIANSYLNVPGKNGFNLSLY